MLVNIGINRIAETLTVLIIFVVVLVITYVVTRFIAGYQKSQMSQGNIRILETNRISQTKYLQLIQVGEVYMVIAVCKDTVTMLTTVEKDQLELPTESEVEQTSFKQVLERFTTQNNKKNNDKQ